MPPIDGENLRKIKFDNFFFRPFKYFPQPIDYDSPKPITAELLRCDMNTPSQLELAGGQLELELELAI